MHDQRATFPTSGSTGAPAPINTYTPIAGMINIPCRDAPMSPTNVQANEVRDMKEILSKGYRHIFLTGYYPQIIYGGVQAGWIATVDGIPFELLGAEPDGSDTQTRLHPRLTGGIENMAGTPLEEKLFAAVEASRAAREPADGSAVSLLRPSTGDRALRGPPSSTSFTQTPKPTYSPGDSRAASPRIQFTIWDIDPVRISDQVEPNFVAFLDQFSSGSGLPGAPAQPNRITNRRDGMFPIPNPPQYQRLIDTEVWNSDLV